MNDMKRVALLCLVVWNCAGLAQADSADTLLASRVALNEQLQRNPFKRPLVLSSLESGNRLTGDVHAIVDYPFDTLRNGLATPAQWCEVVALHNNTKYCRASATPAGGVLDLRVGKKTPEELSSAARFDFLFGLIAAGPEYLAISLNAKDGPMGTSDYRIVFDAIPLPDGRSFVHLHYSYAANLGARLAMQAYLATAGSGKVGFTVVGRDANGQPEYVSGVRGVVERNTMRYYLGIDALLESMSLAPAARFERRMNTWFTATERYRPQLHEMERDTYLAMKRAEHVREQAGAAQ